MDEPILNLGKIDMRGVDIGLKYRAAGAADRQVHAELGFDLLRALPPHDAERSAGRRRGPLQSPGRQLRPDPQPQHGQLDVRALESLFQWRYVHGLKVTNADAVIPGVDLKLSSRSYFDLAVGYNLTVGGKDENGKSDGSGYGVKLQVGIENMFDKDPPLLYQNNVINANTDVETYDTIGRFFFTRVSVNF